MEKSKNKILSSKPNPDKNSNALAKYGGLGFELVAMNLFFIWGGYKLDKYFEFKFPWLVITGLIFASFGTIYYLLKRLNNSND